MSATRFEASEDGSTLIIVVRSRSEELEGNLTVSLGDSIDIKDALLFR